MEPEGSLRGHKMLLLHPILNQFNQVRTIISYFRNIL
jgi:hypothetical protein